MCLSSYSCFRVALQKSQVMTSFRPPMFFPGGATGPAFMSHDLISFLHRCGRVVWLAVNRQFITLEVIDSASAIME